MTSSHFSKGRNCRTGGFPVHSHPRDEEPVQLLLFTFAGLDVHTSDVSGEGVQLDPQAVHQLLLQGRHQQGPNHSYCKCSAFARAKRLTTNANMILFKSLQSRNRYCNRAQQLQQVSFDSCIPVLGCCGLAVVLVSFFQLWDCTSFSLTKGPSS